MTSTAAQEKQEIRKKDYKQLLAKYKNAEEANNFFKLQLQDLNARLNIEHKDKERLRNELHNARIDIVSKPHGHGLASDDIEEVNLRLKEAYKKLEEEFELRDQLSSDLEYTKAMLSAEGKTRMLLENRNTVLEEELKNMGLTKAGEGSVHIQLEETKKRLEEEIISRQKLQEAKEALEAELEDLTKSLFEEANTMVSKEAREKFELLQAKKKLEQELELAKNKILLDEKLLTTMKTKFTTLEMKAKKLHRRTGSATSAAVLPNPAALISMSQIRSTSSHPNLLALKEGAELQRSKSSSLLSHGGANIPINQSVSLPSSPVSHLISADPSPLTSPVQHVLSSTAPNLIELQGPLSPPPTTHPHPNLSQTTAQLSLSHATPTPLTLSKSPPIQIPSASSHLPPLNPVSTSPTNLISVSPINPLSVSPIAHDLTYSDETMSEISHNDNSSVADEEWDVDWLLEGDEERKEDDTTLYAEIDGHIDLQGGLSQFVQFLSTAKHDWTGRYMERVLRDDVGPCLRLRAQEDRAYRKLLEAVWHNRIFVDPLAAPLKEVCAGCGAENTCTWRVRIGSSESKHMGDMCRERIVRTCDFYMYLRNLRQGLVKKTLPNIYKEFLRLRLLMNFARLCAG